MSSSASRAGVTGRVLTWAVAATIACGAGGLSGATSAHAATGSKAGAAHKQVAGQTSPWLDSAFADLDNVADAPGQVFAVTANNGVPFVYDPRAGAPENWVNLRRVTGSQGGFVLNITVAPQQDDATLIGQALVIKARTAAGIYQTVCQVETALNAPVYFTGTPLANCSAWTIVSP